MGKILEALALTRAEGNLPLRALIETQVKHMVRGSTVVLITPSTSREVALMVDYSVTAGIKTNRRYHRRIFLWWYHQGRHNWLKV